MSDSRDAFERIERMFTSGNSVPVERTVIRREDWILAKEHLLRAVRAQYDSEPVGEVYATGGVDNKWVNVKWLNVDNLKTGDKLYTRPLSAGADKINVNSLIESARCLGVSQCENPDAIGYWESQIARYKEQLAPNSAGVPESPTEEMLEEGVMALARGAKSFPGNLTQIVNNIWEDMFSASQQPPKQEGERCTQRSLK